MSKVAHLTPIPVLDKDVRFEILQSNFGYLSLPHL